MKKEILENGMKYYENNDDGHGMEHIYQVMKNMEQLLAIAEKQDNLTFDKELMMTAVLYHDTGNTINRKTHHLESAKIVRNEKYLRKYFTEEQIELIATMCEEHRSSRKQPCTSLESALLNDADSITTLEEMIIRCMKFHMKKDPNATYQALYDDIYAHFIDKFGRNGYQKYRTKYANELTDLEARYQLIENENEFKKLFDATIKEYGF